MTAALTDPVPAWRDRVQASLAALGGEGLASALGLEGKRESADFKVLCPVHNERTPSCGIAERDGHLVWHCFGCDAGGDAIDLVMRVRGLQFLDALEAAADLSGEHGVSSELREYQSKPRTARRARPAPRAVSPPKPPPKTADWNHPPDARAFWRACVPLTSSNEAVAYLRSREQTHGERFDIEAIEARDLARVLPVTPLPSWAFSKGGTWDETGHMIVLPAFNANGERASVRAMRVRDGASPKRLPPAGFTCKGLVLANEHGVELLADSAEREAIHEFEGGLSRIDARLETQRRTVRWPTINLAEGEPDFLLDALLEPGLPVLGLWSGSWTLDIAARVPNAPTFVVSTDQDERGDKYAREVLETLKGRVTPRRRYR